MNPAGAAVASNAAFFASYTNALLAQLSRNALTRQHGIATKLGVLGKAGINASRRRAGWLQNAQTG